jgi:hypothetical protein
MATPEVYPGAATATQISATWTNSSPGQGDTYVVGNAAGYLNGTQAVILDRGTASAEKVLVDYPGTGVTFTVVERGYDGTTATSHENPAHEAVWDAESATEFAAFIRGTGTVTTAHIANDAVTADKIADNAVDSAQIAANAVGSSEIAADAVGSSEIAADAVGTSEIAADAVGTSEIAALAVTSAELASDSVTTAKILDANVTTAKIADLNVTTGKLAAASVTTAKLAQSPTVASTASQVDTGSTVIADDGNYVQLCTDSITLSAAAVVAIKVTVSVRTQGALTGDFDYRWRVQVDNGDHPGGSAMSTNNGWLEVVTEEAACTFTDVFWWPLAAGTYTVDFDMLVAVASAGDLLAYDPSIHTYQLRFA